MPSELEIEISPAEPEVWSEPSFSPERLLSAIRQRAPHLEACRLKSRYARTDKEDREIRALEHELHDLKTRLNKWQGFGVKLDESLLFAQCACDMAGDAENYDQQGLERSLELKIQNHVLHYVQYTAEEVGLFEIALSRSRTSTKAETLFWNPGTSQPVLPDIPPRLISPAKPAVTRTVRVNEPVSETKDPVRDASLAELETLAADDSRPDLQIRASQRLTDLLASRINGRSDRPPLFTSIRVGNDTVMLEAHDCQTLRTQYATAQQAVIGCQKHERSIKCACLASWREWYYSVQRRDPTSPLALAAQNLWDLVERFSQEYQRPKDLSPETLAILEALEVQNYREPDWIGGRSERGIQNQKANAARRREHDYR